MLIRRAPMFRESDVTDEKLYLNRRLFLTGLGAAALAGAEGVAPAPAVDAATGTPTAKGQPLAAKKNEAMSLNETPNKWEDATSYNNFYEFGYDKGDPARLGATLKTRPWTVQVEGLALKKGRVITAADIASLGQAGD